MVELLSPAGSYETMVTAYEAGADAVYLGGSMFGARAYADNLEEEMLLRAIDYTHIRRKKLYLTVNTLLKERELSQELYEYLYPLYMHGLDAVIVQDLGVLRMVRREFPKLSIHASTQMTVTGAHGAAFLEKHGVSRIVTPRELSLEEIKEISNHTNLEIESFVHGALCYCYSGQCLFSSILGGRSGNRGRCAQPCRLPFEVYQEQRRLNSPKEQYPLSPKDMCTIEILPQILEAGVTSLKIEGRMKKPEYTAGVVSIYRYYLDQIEETQGSFQVRPEDYQKLLDLYNRDGFHRSYYQVHNGRDMMALRNEKKDSKGRDVKKARNEMLFDELRKRYIEADHRLPIKGILTLKKHEKMKLTIFFGKTTVTMEGSCTIESALNQPLTKERIHQQMSKTGNTAFYFIDLQVVMDEGIFVPMQVLNAFRRDALIHLEEQITASYRRKGEGYVNRISHDQ